MEDLLDQVEAAMSIHLYQVALDAALTIPDMCAALASKNGLSNGKRYADWFDQHLGADYISNISPKHSFTGKVCWRLRNAMLHQGSAYLHGCAFRRAYFVEPGSSVIVHMGVNIDEAGAADMTLDLPTFVSELVNAARKWLATVKGTEPFESNYASAFRRHPDGIPGKLLGVPVIG